MATVKGVTVYANRDYDGNPVTLATGKYDFHQIADQLKINDTISSIKIPPGYTVTVWEHNFSGKTTTFSADTPYVGDEFSKIISSVEIKYVPPKVEESNNFFGVMKFDGGVITTPGKSLMNDMTAFTLEGWFKVSTATNSLSLFGQNDVTEFAVNNQKLGLWFFSKHYNSKWTSVYSTEPVSPLKWYHAAVVGDENSVRVYRDGQLVASLDDAIKRYGANSNPFTIGAGLYCGGKDTPFYGFITEVRLWKVARSQAEIQATMKQRLTGTEANLIACFPLNEVKVEGSTKQALELVSGNHGIVDGPVDVQDETVPLVL